MSQENPTGQWLECLPWEGQEASLPLGSTVSVPGLDPMKFIYRVKVLDAEEEDGYRMVKKSELKPDDVIIGAWLNEKSVAEVEKTYGKDWLRIIESNGGGKLNRYQWRDKYGTDGLELLAIRNLRAAQNGVTTFKI